MINKNKVILMSRLASYEENQGKQDLRIDDYFWGDYTAMQVIASVGCITLGFFMVLGLYILYHFESLLSDVYQMDLVAVGLGFLKWYIAAVCVYAAVTVAVCTYRFGDAKKRLRKFGKSLNKFFVIQTEKEE